MSVGQTFPQQYQQQFDAKTDRISTQFAEAGLSLPAASYYKSPPEYYRMRAEFRVWHQDDDSYYIMFDPETRNKIRIDQFPVGSQLINDLMTRLRVQFLDNKVLRQRLYQVEFLTTSTGEALISLIYHRKLDEIWETEAKQLSQVLNAHIIGRSRKQRIIVSQNWVEETFQVLGRDYIYRQYENSFTQPNAVVAQNMLIWACEQASNLNGSMVELYCGIGNFTLPLSQQFERVIATEVAKISIKAANHNAEVNDIGNIEFIRGSSEDFSRDWLKSGKASDDLKTLFVDPPRAGLDKDTLALARYFETIIYISCNPDTLLANCSELSDEFVIQEFAFFDQFPYTHHMECGALLIRKTN